MQPAPPGGTEKDRYRGHFVWHWPACNGPVYAGGLAAGVYPLVAAYIAWLVVYAVRSAEFLPKLVAIYGLFIYRMMKLYESRYLP